MSIVGVKPLWIGEVLLDLDEKLGVGEVDAVAGRWAE